MTFNPLARRIVGAWAPTFGGGSVCEMGNQTYTADSKYSSTEAFYRARGFTRYVAMDVNTHLGATIVDLNEIHGFSPEFDLVTNIGTSEHVFDQGAVFRNIHDLAKTWMLHILPFSPWYNHGFFNYNPILFQDLAAANGYYIKELCIANRAGDWKTGDWLFEQKRAPRLVSAVKSLATDVFLVCLFQKTRQDDFRKPIQGKYLQAVESVELKARYAPS